MKVVAILLLVLVLSAGCAAPRPGATPGPSGGTTSSSPVPTGTTSPTPSGAAYDPATTIPELAKCERLVTSYDIMADDARPQMPKGYEPQGLVTNDYAQLNFHVFRCESVILNNETVLAGVTMAMTLLRVAVNKTIAGDAKRHFYMFEFFTTSEALRSLFARAGLNAIQANISAEHTATNGHVQVVVNGVLWYDINTTTGTGGETPSITDVERDHHVLKDGRPSWVEYSETRMFEALPGAAALQAYGGFLHSVRPSSQGVLTGTAQWGTSHGTMVFGHQ